MTSADRKSTRLNSSHLVISYAVFCLKKKNHQLVVILAAIAALLAHLYIPLDLDSNPDYTCDNTHRPLHALAIALAHLQLATPRRPSARDAPCTRSDLSSFDHTDHNS